MPASLVLAAIGLGLCGFFGHLWYRNWSRVRLSGDYGELNTSESYEFLFYASFDTEDEARRCAQLVSYPGLSANVKPTPNDKFWSVTWTINSRAWGPTVRKIRKVVDEGARECRGKLLVEAASKLPATKTA